MGLRFELSVRYKAEIRSISIQALAKALSEVKDDHLAKYADIKIDDVAPSAKKLLELGAFEKVVRVSPPLLEFA